jgi:osmotically-inducible protein OsmY
MKTDSQLQQDVLDELNWEPSVEASRIGVEVKNGVVTLAGHVDSYAQKWGAERAAQRVSGVKGLVVEIDVLLPAPDKRSDADIVEAANGILLWNISIPKDAVKVLVERGWITLSGKVKSAYQRTHAEAALRQLVGVTGVTNNIDLLPETQPHDVKLRIEATLQRRAHRHTKAVDVHVDAGTVTLKGSLDSWAECDAVRRAAWEAPGVRTVIDRLTIAR